LHLRLEIAVLAEKFAKSLNVSHIMQPPCDNSGARSHSGIARYQAS
jgi:hypothetical protein